MQRIGLRAVLCGAVAPNVAGNGAPRRGWARRGSAGLGPAGHGKGAMRKQLNSQVGNRQMRKYEVSITGNTPLLMHWDNIDWADRMDEWKNDPGSKKVSKAGDDRSPAWRWIGSMYHDGTNAAVPSDNLMRCLMEGGAMVPVPGGKSGKTFKSQSQSGMMVNEPFWPVDTGNGFVPIDEVNKLLKQEDFAVHKQTAEEFGFSLFVKRAKVGASKHIRVRPRFDTWSAKGTLTVWDDQITERVLIDILRYAGQYKGLGDWRPGSKTPGSFGMFAASVKAV
jgi:hypothetical protein